MRVLLWAHVAGFALYAVMIHLGHGEATSHLGHETGALPTPAFLAVLGVLVLLALGTSAPFGRRTLMVVMAIGLNTCSALLVALSGGLIEFHFHFFVIVAVVALYQEWLPFFVSILFVVLDHAVVGVLAPGLVFSHHMGHENPLRWALLHGFFILAASVVNLQAWRLAEDEQVRHQHVLSGGEGVYGIDPSGNVTFVNPAMLQLIDQTEREVLGRHHHDLLGHFTDRDGSQDHTGCATCLVTTAPYTSTTRFPAWFGIAGGARIPVLVLASPLRDRGRIAGSIVTFQDVSERRVLEERLTFQAQHDALTGLPNRLLFLDRLIAALERAADSQLVVAVYFLDLDRFKRVNDSMGHPVGDVLLGAVAARLRTILRQGDTLSRFGGDEFAVLSEDMSSAAASDDLARRLVGAFDQPFRLDQTETFVSASVGVVAVRGGAHDPAGLLRDADVAMYAAKSAGRGRWRAFSEQMQVESAEALRTTNQLHHAVDRGELRLHYQPIVNLQDGRIVGMEALVRWEHPTRGLLGPSAFVPLAEETGLIVPIGRWVLRNALRQLKLWERHDVYVSVNLSARQLIESTLVQDVADLIVETGVRPERLCLEITETALFSDLDKTVTVLGGLKRLGVWLALDDFGQGQSSLANLRRFPVDVLKIDAAFVATILESAGIVTTIIELGRCLDLAVIAEGVEDTGQMERLQALGCPHGQGYFFARPAPAQDIELLLADRETELWDGTARPVQTTAKP